MLVTPGTRYRLIAYDILYAEDSEDADSLPSEPSAFGYTSGMPARGADVVAIEKGLLDRLHRSGRPLAGTSDRRAVVDHDSQTMTVTLRIAPGPSTVFGPLQLEGLADVEEDYIRSILRWPEGRAWDERELDSVRQILAGTNLFRTIQVQSAETVGEDGRLSVTARVEESKHRTLAAGINYSTDEKFGGELSWEHRNLFGREEFLRLAAEGTGVRQQVSTDLRKPHVLSRDLTFLANVTGRAQQTDAFDEHTGAGLAGLEKHFAEIWTLGVSVSAEYSVIEEDGLRSNFAIVGMPLRATRDSTDDRLDPTGGTRLEFSVTPYAATVEQDVNFAVFETAASAYMGLGEADRVVPAIRLRVGSIAGADTAEIPITKRLFAGGGGSVRGYEFQKAGPLDPDGDPTGGRSAIETGFELRWRLTDRIGVVPFAEGGNVYDEPAPDLSEDLFWAAGLGFRYFTVAGPVRLDVAFPLNGREGIDDDFQIYISLGQAF